MGYGAHCGARTAPEKQAVTVFASAEEVLVSAVSIARQHQDTSDTNMLQEPGLAALTIHRAQVVALPA